jgi:hypothetical protein
MLERATLKLPLHNHSNPYIKCRISVVSVRSTVPREVKVEISVARAVGFAIRASMPYFLLLRQKRSYEVYNGEKIPINENA